MPFFSFMSYFDEPTSETRTPWCTVHFISFDFRYKWSMFILFSSPQSLLYRQINCSITNLFETLIFDSWAHFLSVVNNITPRCLFASWFSRSLLLGISDFKNSKRSVLINKRRARQTEKINLCQPSHWLSIFKRIAENQSPQLFSHLAWTMEFFV